MTETNPSNLPEPTPNGSNESSGSTGSTASEDTSTSTFTEEGQQEEFTISGDSLVAKIKELIEETTVRRIVIKNPEDQVLIEIPLTVGVTAGVIGTALFPLLAAVGAIGAVVANLKLVVIRTDPES